MRSLVLGAFVFASFGLTAYAAEPPSDARAVSHAKRACHWVTADRSLRLLRDTLPSQRRAPAERLAGHPVSSPVKEPAVRASRPVVRSEPVHAVSRPEPVRLASRAELVRFERPAHLSLMVGIGY